MLKIYIGDDQLDALATIKSKEELLGELIGLLQSPAQRVIAALQNNAEREEKKLISRKYYYKRTINKL